MRFSQAFRLTFTGIFAALGVATATLVFPVVLRAADAPAAASKAFLVADDKSGHILLQSRSTDKLQIASLTKIATATVALDWARVHNHPLDTPVSIPGSVLAAYHDNPIGFQEDDEISLRDRCCTPR